MPNQTYFSMKKIGLLILLITSVSIVAAQKNVSKLRYSPVPIVGNDVTKGVMELLNGVISFSQERKLNDRMSLQATFRYLPTKTNGILDSITTVEYNNEDYNPWGDPTFSGLGAFLDLKIYGEEKGAMTGFYWGPYLHTMTYKLQSKRDYLEGFDGNGMLYYGEAQTRYKMSNLGIGIQIGTQKIWDNGLTLDWTILGIGLNGVLVSAEIDVENTSGNFDFRDYEEDINNDADFFINNPSIEIERESVKFSSKRYFNISEFSEENLPFINFRMGLSLGFGYGK
jgi:hypothetical protein